MKKIILICAAAAAMLLGSADLFGQGKYGADSANCIKYLSYYKEYYKAKNYNDAIPSWRNAYRSCPPTANQTMLIDGTTLMRFLINKNANNAIYRKELIDSLFTLYDVRAQYYPKYKVTAMNNKGLDMINYIKDDTKSLYEGCKAIGNANKEQTKPQIFLFMFNSSVDLYQAGQLGVEDVLNDYEYAINSLEDVLNATTDDGKDAVMKMRTDVENLFISSKVASCDNLVALFTPRFEADPKNADQNTKIIKMLSSTEGGTETDLFYNAVNNLYEVDPSYTSAYFLYKLNASKGNVADAIKFLEQAIESPDSDNATDAQYYYELALYSRQNGKGGKAFESAVKAAELDESYSGKSYMICGTIWGSQSCGSDYISKRAPYWVAVDYLNKAKNADPSLADECNNLIRQYSVYYPEASEAFMYDLTNGQSYTVSCNGMRATTTVRTQK